MYGVRVPDLITFLSLKSCRVLSNVFRGAKVAGIFCALVFVGNLPAASVEVSTFPGLQSAYNSVAADSVLVTSDFVYIYRLQTNPANR